MNWQDRARTLRIGEKRKVPHCSTSPSAYISNSVKGVRLHCFRCGANEFEPHDKLSAADVLAMRRADETAVRQVYPKTTRLDAPECPTGAHVWVLKAGITPEVASTKFGLGWNEFSQRVVVPILHDGEPTGIWTARAVDDRKPKYLMPRGCAGEAWYNMPPGAPVVIVEDVLSAIKLTLAGYGAMAVLGTAVGPRQVSLLAGREVVGWFDGDAAGRNGYVRLRKALGPVGITPSRIETPRDPKTYSVDRIKKYMEMRNDGC